MCAAHKERFLGHQITNLLITGSGKPEIHSVLTVTEIDILKLIARGKSVKEIALKEPRVFIPLSPTKRIFSGSWV